MRISCTVGAVLLLAATSNAVFAAEPAAGTPQQFAAFMAAETIKWATVIKAAGARVDY